MIWGVVAYAAILVSVAAGLSSLYRSSRDRLDEALGKRLLAVATTTTQLVDGSLLDPWSLDPEPSLDFLWLTSRIQQIRRSNDLAEITLCDTSGFVLISASGRLDKGELDVFWDLDRPAVSLAQQGFPSASRLYRNGSLYQKSAHAPVFDGRGRTVGILTVEGDADFFDTLTTLRTGALITGAAVLILLAVLGLLLHRVTLALERYRLASLRQENLAAMGRMTAGIAHEIRNPLGIIRGSGQHLERVLGDHGLEDPATGFITEEVDRLDQVLTGYLAFGTDTTSETETVDLARLARRTLAMLADDLAPVVVAIDEPLAEATCQGDPRRLQQVVLNLLLNARDAMPDGGIITLALSADSQDLSLQIRDEGPGLPIADPNKLFEPFWTTKEKGSGLGLAVSRRIAQEHHGRLELANRIDQSGTVATLTLPRTRKEA